MQTNEGGGLITTQASESDWQYDDDSASSSLGNLSHLAPLGTVTHRLRYRTPFFIFIFCE